MAWITPKTNWVATDLVNASDYNRIAGNLNFLKSAMRLMLANLNDDKTISDLPYPGVWNAVEQDLESVNNLSYRFDIGDTQTFYANQPYISAEELNRIERYINQLYVQYWTQKDASRHFYYRMGESSWRSVPRVHYVTSETMGYRCGFRLGSMKGVNV